MNELSLSDHLGVFAIYIIHDTQMKSNTEKKKLYINERRKVLHLYTTTLTSSSACDLVDNINSTNVNVIDVIAQV